MGSFGFDIFLGDVTIGAGLGQWFPTGVPRQVAIYNTHGCCKL